MNECVCYGPLLLGCDIRSCNIYEGESDFCMKGIEVADVVMLVLLLFL